MTSKGTGREAKEDEVLGSLKTHLTTRSSRARDNEFHSLPARWRARRLNGNVRLLNRRRHTFGREPLPQDSAPL